MFAFSKTAHSPSLIAFIRTESTHSNREAPLLHVETSGLSLSKVGACLLMKTSSDLTYACKSKAFAIKACSRSMMGAVKLACLL